MTDLATALANVDLGEFEGARVLGVGIEIPGAAGGLRDALGIDPWLGHKGQTVMVLLECGVEKIRHEPVKDTDGWRRVHVLKTTAATIVDGDTFTEALTVQRERIDKAKRDAAGTTSVEDAIELQAAHDDGEHADGLVDNCPSCVEEQDTADAGD